MTKQRRYCNIKNRALIPRKTGLLMCIPAISHDRFRYKQHCLERNISKYVVDICRPNKLIKVTIHCKEVTTRDTRPIISANPWKAPGQLLKLVRFLSELTVDRFQIYCPMFVISNILKLFSILQDH